MKAYVNKLHVEYIATRPGTIFNENKNHGLFGNIYDGERPLDLEDLELTDIEKVIENRSKQNIDVFKTVFSMKEEDVLRYGLSQDKWKDILKKRITDIARASNIPPESIEWTASFHSKKNNPHCHLVFWNKDQNLELNKKPFLNFKGIRKCVSKEIFKGELEALYDTKNVSKQQIKDMTKEELTKYKEALKKELKNPDLTLEEVDTKDEERLLEALKEKLKVGEKVYLYNKLSPEMFVEISKEKETLKRRYYGNEIIEENEVLKFRNSGMKSFLYKDGSLLESACFLTDFREIRIAKSKEDLEKVIKEKTNEDTKIDNLLREVCPSLVPNSILSNNFREKSFDEITSKITNLKSLILEENRKTLGKEKLTFRYDYQTPKVKKEIDRISLLVLNTSKDCKLQFEKFVGSQIDIARTLQEIENKTDYRRVKEASQDEAYKKIGNQILSFLKESINENYNEDKEKRKEEWERKKAEYEAKNLEYKVKQEEFEARKKEYETRNLINSITNMFNTENISLQAKNNRLKVDFGSMTKEQIKEYMELKKNSNGFDWFNEGR
mgnify:CR=1 FL=1